MNKLLLPLLLALFCADLAQAQEADYQPLVREGVRWVCQESFGVLDAIVEGPDEIVESYKYFNHTYAIEFCGDTIINGKEYKKCYRTHLDGDPLYTTFKGQMIRTSSLLFSNSRPAAYMREEDKKISCIAMPLYGDGVFVMESEVPFYDFSMGQQARIFCPDEIAFNDDNFSWLFDRVDEVEIDGKTCGVYVRNNRYGGNDAYLVEGVGFVSSVEGDLIVQTLWYAIDGPSVGNTHIGLCYLENLEGDIIYKGPLYSDNSELEQVSKDNTSQSADPRWYNLMGQPFDNRPTIPSIYIHQGKKVVVK